MTKLHKEYLISYDIAISQEKVERVRFVYVFADKIEFVKNQT